MKRNLRVILAAICTVGIVGIVGSSWAAPDGSQRLRGLGDRVFLVTAELTADPFGITGLPIGTTFGNCYIFEGEPDADGYNWFESAFPDVKGNWYQDSNGAKTSYAVTADSGPGTPLITQQGQVTPARGKGVLQMVVDSFVDIIPFFPGPELEFNSVGEEIAASEAEDRCPTILVPTLPE